MLYSSFTQNTGGFEIIITKFGTVTIHATGVTVSGFEFDAQGKDITVAEFGIAACKSAIERLERELGDVEVVVGTGNTWNGNPL